MRSHRFRRLLGVFALCMCSPTLASAADGPLQVFILSGQSNMQGHAAVSTFDYIGKDPKTAPMLGEMVGQDGNPTVSERVWISYLSQGRGGEPVEKSGALTAGFGAREDCIGPEFTFGLTMEKLIDEPILIIKTAWGGKSLYSDFRPPSAGPYEFHEKQLEQMKSQGKDIEAAKAEAARASGHYYRLMMEHVRKVLADPGKVFPAYDPEKGYEIAGFVWFQGWNDMVNSGVYPDRGKPGGYAAYSDLLATFIEDVRKDLKAPKLPFVVGVMGTDGPVDMKNPGRYGAIHQGFRDAMAEPAGRPGLRGTVVNVLTERFWDPLQTTAVEKRNKIRGEVNQLKKEGREFERGEEQKLIDERLKKELSEEELAALGGISNQGFHYLGSAKVLGSIGKAFAEAMAPMLEDQ